MYGILISVRLPIWIMLSQLRLEQGVRIIEEHIKGVKKLAFESHIYVLTIELQSCGESLCIA